MPSDSEFCEDSESGEGLNAYNFYGPNTKKMYVKLITTMVAFIKTN